MALLRLKQATLSHLDHPLLDHVDFVIQPRERVCIVGRNGVGKSTLLKVLNGDILLEDGEMHQQQGLIVAMMQQSIPHDINAKVFEVAKAGLKKEAQDWEIERAISQVGLNPEDRFEALSGGLKRRALLAAALANDPDALLLDEPTNHLDIEAILWLEKFLLSFTKTIIFISHDRSFIENVATRIVDLDRGHLQSFDGNFSYYLNKKAEMLENEEKAWNDFDKKLAIEETWIRQGIKARRTRNEGRVRALKAMRAERQSRREKTAKAKSSIDEGAVSGRLVVRAKGISFAYDDKKIVKGFSTTIMRGDKIGIVGPNGIGKTTLIRLLLKQIDPDQGTVKLGTNLETAYFDQMRETLDPEALLVDVVSDGKDTVTINGKSKHVIGYLQDFLFTPVRARAKVKTLSGGERNRLLLAKLLTRQANLFVLDEPTNDLDLETLELLESLFVEYQSTLLIVSHDRAFLNNVCSSIVASEGDGHWQEYVGGYDDYLRQKREETLLKTEKHTKDKSKRQKQKLSYNEQRELETLPKKLDSLESAIEAQQSVMGDPEFYKKSYEEIQEEQQKLDDLEKEFEECFERWESLERLQQQYS